MFDINICNISIIISEKDLRLDANDVNNSKVVTLNDKGKPKSGGYEMLDQEIDNHLRENVKVKKKAECSITTRFLRDYKGLMENGDYERCEKLCLEAIHVNQSNTQIRSKLYNCLWYLYENGMEQKSFDDVFECSFQCCQFFDQPRNEALDTQTAPFFFFFLLQITFLCFFDLVTKKKKEIKVSYQVEIDENIHYSTLQSMHKHDYHVRQNHYHCHNNSKFRHNNYSVFIYLWMLILLLATLLA
ncbi:hypothetical protein RFI_36230, partial [Reticulomyxa filosa]